jgi:hypothetical protein
VNELADAVDDGLALRRLIVNSHSPIGAFGLPVLPSAKALATGSVAATIGAMVAEVSGSGASDGADSGPCGQLIPVDVGTENALMWAAIPL